MKNLIRNILTLCFVSVLFLCTEGKPAGQCRELTHQDAPQNGGLICLELLQHKYCAARCDDGYDFLLPPRHFDMCGVDTGYRWTHQISSVEFNECIQTFFDGLRTEGDEFYFPGNCSQLNAEAQNSIMQAFIDKVVPSSPVGLQHLTLTGKLICHGTENVVTLSGKKATSGATECKTLTSAEAPKNGAIVCYSDQNKKYCAARCNSGFEFPGRVELLDTCGPESGFKWSFDGERYDPCIEPFFWSCNSFEDSRSYLPQTCDQLTLEEQLTVKENFKELLEARDVNPDTVGEITITCGE